MEQWSSQGVILDDDIVQVLKRVRKVSESSAEKFLNGQTRTQDDQPLSLGGDGLLEVLREAQNQYKCADIERTDSLEFSD